MLLVINLLLRKSFSSSEPIELALVPLVVAVGLGPYEGGSPILCHPGQKGSPYYSDVVIKKFLHHTFQCTKATTTEASVL